MVSCAAPRKKTPNVFLSVSCRVTRASGSNPAVKKTGGPMARYGVNIVLPPFGHFFVQWLGVTLARVTPLFLAATGFLSFFRAVFKFSI